jgi:mRNA interferase MazF
MRDRGDLVRLTLDPHAGLEHAGRRSALVLFPALYNSRAGFALVLSISTQVKHCPFKVGLPDGFAISGGVLADKYR